MRVGNERRLALGVRVVLRGAAGSVWVNCGKGVGRVWEGCGFGLPVAVGAPLPPNLLGCGGLPRGAAAMARDLGCGPCRPDVRSRPAKFNGVVIPAQA
jgi:hypothetical protein